MYEWVIGISYFTVIFFLTYRNAYVDFSVFYYWSGRDQSHQLHSIIMVTKSVNTHSKVIYIGLDFFFFAKKQNNRAQQKVCT